jgi:hypothetical protein
MTASVTIFCATLKLQYPAGGLRYVERHAPAHPATGGGLDVEPFPQTYLKFSPVAKSFEVFVNRKVVRHRGDPVLAWAIGNVVMESDANANIKPNKKKSSNKIDGGICADGVRHLPG